MPEYIGPKRAGDVAAAEAERWLNEQVGRRRAGDVRAQAEQKESDAHAAREKAYLTRDADLNSSESEYYKSLPGGSFADVDGTIYGPSNGGDPFEHPIGHEGETPFRREEFGTTSGEDPPAQRQVVSSLPTDSKVLVNAPGPVHRAASEWGSRVGERAAEHIVEAMPAKSLQALRAFARRNLDAIHAAREARPTVGVVQSFGDRLNPHQKQDAQLRAIEEAAAEARRQLHPVDGGEIDAPQGPRPPIQMQREFSNDQEKEAYLERIRQAQKNAGPK